MPPTFAAASTTWLGRSAQRTRRPLWALAQVQLQRAASQHLQTAGLQGSHDGPADETAMTNDITVASFGLA